MVRALYCVVWCSKGQTGKNWKKKMNKKENEQEKKPQLLINVFFLSIFFFYFYPPTSNRPALIPWALVWQRRTISQKSKIKLRTFQYIQKTSRLPFNVCYSRIKQRKKKSCFFKKRPKTSRGVFIPVFLCVFISYYLIFFFYRSRWFVFHSVPCSVNAWHDSTHRITS